VGTPKTTDASVELPKDLAKAAALAEKTVSELVLKEAGATAPALTFPAEPVDLAVKDYASCAELLGRQPIGVEIPTVLNEGELQRAQGACERAVKAAPSDAEAWAALSLVDAVAGKDEAAAAAMTKATALKVTHHLPNLVLTRFWLAGRYQSGDAAVKVLKDAIQAEPGFLLARVYLGELYNALGQHELAAQAWKDYASVTRTHPFVMSKLGYTLARLGKQDEAAAFAEKAFAFDRESVDLSLELASRYVDAGQPEKAVAVLEPLAQAKDARGEVLLRLGYVRQKQGQAADAETLMTRAVAAATEPSEWRTRGRAKLNLAVLAIAKGKKDEAKKLATDAAKEGVKLTATPETKDVVALFTPAELSKLGSGPKTKETSPLPLSGGEVDPAAKRAPAPKGL
jgi:tetratricopeptide (TPR) repeat protein